MIPTEGGSLDIFYEYLAAAPDGLFALRSPGYSAGVCEPLGFFVLKKMAGEAAVRIGWVNILQLQTIAQTHSVSTIYRVVYYIGLLWFEHN